MSENYPYMEPVVDKIVESLLNEPFMWEFGVYTFHHLKRPHIKHRFSLDCTFSQKSSYDEIDTPASSKRVFSHSQGVRIWEAVKVAREIQANSEQKKLMKAWLDEKEAPKNNSQNPEKKDFWQRTLAKLSK